MGTLHEDLCTFMMISRWSLLRVRNIPDKICRENKITILCSITFFFTENLAVCEVMRENTVVLDRPQMAVRRVRFGCCIIKATNTTFRICNTAFPRQQSFHDRFLVLHCTYIARLVSYNLFIVFLQFSFLSLFSIFFLLFYCFLIFPSHCCRWAYGGNQLSDYEVLVIYLAVYLFTTHLTMVTLGMWIAVNNGMKRMWQKAVVV